MNVASLELSKELYELSGWTGTALLWQPDGDIGLMGPTSSERPPAYDLGYLLRKLPLVRLQHVALESDDLKRWLCSVKSVSMAEHAETPENAAAKLAIELFKQGVLTKEGL